VRGAAGPLLRKYAGVSIAAAALVYATVASVLFLHGSWPRHRAEAAWFIAATVAFVVLAVRSTPSIQPDEIESRGTPENRRRRDLVSLALFVSASFALYFRVLHAGLFSDDFVLLQHAEAGQLSRGTGFFRPLPMLVWAAASQFGPADPIALHAINVVGHGVNAWLLYLIARALGISYSWSLLAAALCVASPASVESVVWISALFDVLMVSGTLAYVLACLTERRLLACAGLAVALLSKETGVVAAFLGVLIATTHRRSLRTSLIGVGVTVVFTGIRLWLLPPPEAYFAEPSKYMLNELVPRAFGALGLPWTAADIAPHPFLVLFPWLALACVTAIAIPFRVPRIVVATVFLLIAWVIASVLPVYHSFFVAPTLEGSRYLYLGSAAFALLLARLGSTARSGLPRRCSALLLITSIVTGVRGALIHQEPWIAAAAQRESVLAAARETLDGADCASISVSGVPDSYMGAFIFRNGFKEALARDDIQTPPIREGDAECAYKWTGSGFVR
jgi:hypothetical protein